VSQLQAKIIKSFGFGSINLSSVILNILISSETMIFQKARIKMNGW
jgi:hypothetical protein